MYIVTFSLFVFLTLWTLSLTARKGFTEIDRSKYEDGKANYELMEGKTSLPRYGTCWKDAIITMQKGCKELTDVVQSHLALAYLNCFNEVQGRQTYSCDWGESIADCTVTMSDVDRGSYTTFFTYAQNICYFLESQVWHQETEKTMDRLSSNSAEVATRLEESSELQEEMMKRQNRTLINQAAILKTAENLSFVIASSKDNIHEMFSEFKKTTNEQRLLINDVFDKVSRLQTMVLGEFSGFYSIIYYTLAVLISYLLTSTQRTSSARFWLFGVMTFGMVMERLLISFGINTNLLVDAATEAEAGV